MIVNCEVLTLAEILLFALRDNIDHGRDRDIDLGNVRRYLELDLILLLISELDIFVSFRYGDIIDLVDSLQGDLGLLEESQISKLSIIENEGRLHKYLCTINKSLFFFLTGFP